MCGALPPTLTGAIKYRYQVSCLAAILASLGANIASTANMQIWQYRQNCR